MIFRFLSPEELSVQDIPLPLDVLRQSLWVLEAINAPYLAGKAGEPDHGYGRISDEELEFRMNPKLKKGEPTTEDEKKVVGDIGDFLGESSKVIVAETRDFKKAEVRAESLGYRPAKAGEFLQILWRIKSKVKTNYGWYYCYQNRVSNYAILARFDRKGDIHEIIFDTNYDDLGYMDGNMESLCFFVK